MKIFLSFPSFLILLTSFNCSLSKASTFNLAQNPQPSRICLVLQKELVRSQNEMIVANLGHVLSTIETIDSLNYQSINKNTPQVQQYILKKGISKLEFKLRMLNLRSQSQVLQGIRNRKCSEYIPILDKLPFYELLQVS